MTRFAWMVGVLLLLSASVLRAEEETLGPTPHATPDAAMRLAASRGWKRSREAEAPVDADVVGAITPLSDDRLGFMPMLQHHMAVEHWFLEGPSIGELSRKAASSGGRAYVRLRGKQTLLGVFGGEGLEWYGTGLQHGRDWGPVMGYHERIYRLSVEEVVWVRTLDAQARAQRAVTDLNRHLQADLERLDYAAATRTLAQVVEGTQDAGLDPRGLEQTAEYLRRMAILERDSVTWSDADRAVVAQAFVLEPFVLYRELKKDMPAKLTERSASWPQLLREDIGRRAVEAWKALPYRHQRDKARTLLFALDAPATRALASALASAEERMQEAKQRLKELVGTGDYAGMLAVLDAVQEDQALVLDYQLAESQTKHWVPAARRLAALQAVLADPARRETLLAAQIQETLAAGTGLPNSNAKPRYNPEVNARVAPLLSEAERERIESMLLEHAQRLRPSDDWKQVLLVAELLSGFGGSRARAYFPTLLRRSARQPRWQREHLERFATALTERAPR